MKDRVAVITGFYKTPYFLKILFECLNKQTFRNFDVYVYNTSASSLEAIENISCNFSYSIINLEKNVGFAEAIMQLLKKPKANMITNIMHL